MKVINDKKRLLFTSKEKTSGILVVAPEELILVEENNIKEDTDISGKLDKVSTAGVERAYIINADGSQGTKATSEWVNANNYRKWLVKDTTPTTAVTGTTSLTQIGSSILIPANTFSAEDVMVLEGFRIEKPVGLSNCNQRLHHNTSNTLVGATDIARLSSGNTVRSARIIRTFEISGGLLKCSVSGTDSVSFDLGIFAVTPLSIPFNPTIDNYFFTTVQLGNASDSVTRTQLLISK